MKVHFFTLVLNGMPFIRYHVEMLQQLRLDWVWHVVEGVAELKYDTAWSLATGGKIPPDYHYHGRSIDGTTEYLDELARGEPRVQIYRQAADSFWDGKLSMCQAPLAKIVEPAVLWQLDSDELWTAAQIETAVELFARFPEQTAAYFYCHYFVGPELVIRNRDCYGNHPAYEWLRAWRYRPGDHWQAHEPPRLVRAMAGDLGHLNPIRHAATEAAGLVFQHFAYSTRPQVHFKESYYGYAGAVQHWERLQLQSRFPVKLRDFFSWVTDEAEVVRADALGLTPLAVCEQLDQEWSFR